MSQQIDQDEQPVEGTLVLQDQIIARERTERIRAGIENCSAVLAEPAESVRREDWRTLGYDGPAAWSPGEGIAEAFAASDRSQCELVAELRHGALALALR